MRSPAGRRQEQTPAGNPSGEQGASTAEAADPLAPLVAAVRAGDSGAVQPLLRALTPTVFRVAVGVLGRHDPDVDDVVQESLVAVLQATGRFRGDSHMLYFASRVTLRIAMRWRQRHRRRRVEEPQTSQRDREVTAPEDAEPGEALLTKEVRKAWDRLLHELPDAQAEVLTLRVLGYSLEETAATMQVPVNTIRSRLSAARARMQKRLSAHPELADLLGVT